MPDPELGAEAEALVRGRKHLEREGGGLPLLPASVLLPPSQGLLAPGGGEDASQERAHPLDFLLEAGLVLLGGDGPGGQGREAPALLFWFWRCRGRCRRRCRNQDDGDDEEEADDAAAIVVVIIGDESGARRRSAVILEKAERLRVWLTNAVTRRHAPARRSVAASIGRRGPELRD